MAINKEDISTNLYNEESQSQYYFADDSGDSILISDEQLLFLGEYSREGADLHITHGNKNVVIDNYFSQQQTPDLTADNGATLTHDVVEALAGPLAPGQYVQAGLAGNLTKIGEVINLTGTANSKTVDGVESELVVGSAVYQGDVVSTGADSKLGISFIDKSAFSMSADARMILDELIFTPNTPEDSSMVFNLVEGAFVFVTGEVATTGNMKIETPVATMGIRGTTPKVTVNSSLGVAEFSILPDPGSGKVGSYQLINKSTGAILGTVASVGDKWVMTTLSDEVVQIGKSGSDLLEDNLALDEIRAVISGSLGDKTELDGSNQFDQVNIDDDNSGEEGEGEEGEGEESGEGEEGGGEEGDTSEFDDPPEAGDDAFAIDEDTLLEGEDANVVSDAGGGADVDPDGFGFSVTHVNGAGLNFVGSTASILLPSGAILLITAKGEITYDPRDAYNFLGLNDVDVDTFNYTITDAGGQTDTANVTITITGRNDSPEITALASTKHSDDFTEAAGSTGAITTRTALGVINFKDVDASDTHIVGHEFTSLVWTKNVGGTENINEIGSLSPVLTEPAQVTNPTIVFDANGAFVSKPGDVVGDVGLTYTVNENQLDFLAAGETLLFTYTVTITDDSGVGAGLGSTNGAAFVTQEYTVTITGTNDAPVITVGALNTDAVTLDETNSELVTSGTLTVEDVDISDEITASVQSLVVSGDSDRFDAAAPDDAALLAMFSVTPTTIIASGNTTAQLTWDFDSDGEVFDYLASGETLILTYTVRAQDDDPTTPLNDTQIVTVTIEGTNDAPIITADGVGDSIGAALDETNGTLTATGSLTVSDVDTSNSVSASIVTLSVGGTSSRSDAAAPDDNTLKGMLSLVEQAIVDNTENTSQLTWNFNSAGEAFNYLATDETLILTYTVIRALDSDSSNPLTDTETVTITITGTNDAPVISIDSGDRNTSALSETNGTLTDTDTLTVTDVDTTDVVTALVESVVVVTGAGETTNSSAAPDNGVLELMMLVTPSPILADGENTGPLNWSFNSGGVTFDYLATGEKLVLNYTIKVTDNDSSPLSDTEIITVTITGTNDVPVISVETGDGDTLALDETNSTLSGSDTLTVTDVDTTDLVTAIVESVAIGTGSGETANPGNAPAGLLAMMTLTSPNIVSGVENSNTLTWNFDSSSSSQTFDYLATGEILVLDYTIKVTDDDGATDTHVVKVTITGTNDAPVVAAAIVDSADEGDTAFTIDMLAGASDIDTGETATLGVQNLSALPAGITFSGTTLTVDPTDAAYDSLAAGVDQILVVNYEVVDAQGITVNQSVTVTITGTNDAPTVAAAITQSANEGDAAFTVDMLTGAADVDTGETATLGVTNVTGLSTGVTFSGTTLSVDPTNAVFDSLGAGVEQDIVVNYDVIDAQNETVAQTATITITGVNDIPVIGSVLTDNVNYFAQDVAAIPVDSSVTITDPDHSLGSNAYSATVQISGNFVSGQDELGWTDVAGITSNYNAATGTLTLTGDTWLGDYQAVFQSITYENTSGTPTESTRTITFSIDEGAQSSNVYSVNMAVFDANLIVGTSGNDTGGTSLDGNAGNNAIFGLDGDDQLFGDGGNDLLVGGAGVDQLSGGTGNDVFTFLDTVGMDTVLDFDIGDDVINLADFLDGMTETQAGNAITISQNGANTVLTIGGNDVVTLNNIGSGDAINVVFDDLENVVVINGFS